MRAILIKTVHETFLPKGTVGDLYEDSEGYTRFIPDSPVEGYGFSSAGAYIDPARVRVIANTKEASSARD